MGGIQEGQASKHRGAGPGRGTGGVSDVPMDTVDGGAMGESSIASEVRTRGRVPGYIPNSALSGRLMTHHADRSISE